MLRRYAGLILIVFGLVSACDDDDAGGGQPLAGASGSGSAGTQGGAAAGAGSGGSGGSAGSGVAGGRAGSGGSAGTSAAGSGGGSGAAAGSGGGTARPPEVCKSPLALASVTNATTVVGTGDAASCNEGALRGAIATGGVITFACGAKPVTIPITQTLKASPQKDTTIDGADLVTLDGGGTTQILSAAGSDWRANDKTLTLQRLVMMRGKSPGDGFKARDGDKKCAWGYKNGGGGALYVRDVNVHVWGVTFLDNQGPELGPDVAGGAIYAVGAKKLIIASSTFRNNRASNGGALGMLHTSTELYNVVLENNRATGQLANFANATGCPEFNHEEQGGAGGLGGAFYSDGQDPGDVLCGVRMSDNRSGDLGGAVFRSAYWGLISGSPKQELRWEQVTFERNESPVGGGGAGYLNNALFSLTRSRFTGNDSGESDGGALKLTGLTIQADDVEFTNNKAVVGGAVAHWSGGPDGDGSAENIRYSGNSPDDAAGNFPD